MLLLCVPCTTYAILLRLYLITTAAGVCAATLYYFACTLLLLLQECAQRLADAEALARRAHEEYSDWLGTPFAAEI